jgi:hypothetical protein
MIIKYVCTVTRKYSREKQGSKKRKPIAQESIFSLKTKFSPYKMKSSCPRVRHSHHFAFTFIFTPLLPFFPLNPSFSFLPLMLSASFKYYSPV